MKTETIQRTSTFTLGTKPLLIGELLKRNRTRPDVKEWQKLVAFVVVGIGAVIAFALLMVAWGWNPGDL